MPDLMGVNYSKTKNSSFINVCKSQTRQIIWGGVGNMF